MVRYVAPSGDCGSATGAESRGGAEAWALAGPPPPSGGPYGAGGVPASCVLPADAAHAPALRFRGGGRERRVPPAGEETRPKVGLVLCGRERRRRADEEGFRGGESQRGGEQIGFVVGGVVRVRGQTGPGGPGEAPRAGDGVCLGEAARAIQPRAGTDHTATKFDTLK